jgi:2-keto-3-deoxy-L-arabinonate dehydratase
VALFAGIIPILPTPFDAEGAIDEAAFSTIVDFAIERAKSDVLAMFGFGSEFYKLTDSERSRLVHLTITSARGRRPVIISVTHQATRVAVEQAREAEAAGTSRWAGCRRWKR